MKPVRLYLGHANVGIYLSIDLFIYLFFKLISNLFHDNFNNMN